MYIGDFLPGQTVRFLWNSAGANGASITRATNGTVSVYKDGGTTQFTTGVTDTEDFDGLTGVHLVSIDTSNAAYAPGSHFDVVLSGATIDGVTVNAHLFSFSILRQTAGVAVQGLAQAGGSSTVTLPATASAVNDYYLGALVVIAAGTGAGQSRYVGTTAGSYVGSTKVATLAAAWTTNPDTTSVVLVFANGDTSAPAVDVSKWNGTAVATPDTAGHPKVTVKNGTGSGELVTASGRANANLTAVDGTTTAVVSELTTVPPVNGAGLLGMWQYLYHKWRNKVEVTDTSRIVRRDDGTTALSTEVLAFDGTTFTDGEAT